MHKLAGAPIPIIKEREHMDIELTSEQKRLVAERRAGCRVTSCRDECHYQGECPSDMENRFKRENAKSDSEAMFKIMNDKIICGRCGSPASFAADDGCLDVVCSKCEKHWVELSATM